MKISTLFCFPTRREGLPLVVIEAMASGLPIVISRLEGITTDLVTTSTGIIVDGFDSQDYAAAMDAILAHPEKVEQMRQSARQRALTEFNLDGVVEKWLALMDNLAHSPSTAKHPPTESRNQV